MTDHSSHGLKPQTLCVHAGEPRPPLNGAVTLPVFQTSTYLLGDGEHDYHRIRYLRLNNSPNHDALGQKLAALEGTEAGLVAASGMAAITAALLAFLKNGDHVIAQDCLYGGTRVFLDQARERYGIAVTYVSLERPAEWEAALRSTTKLFYVESITNPLIEVGRLDEAAAFAKRRGILSLIDSTFTSPINFQPARLGYDIILHSATKYLNGHSDLVAGAIAGRQSLVDKVRENLNILGGALDAHACFLLQRGLKTLPLRMRCQNENARQLAAWLARHAQVASVRYPGLETDAAFARARAWFSGAGGMLSFVPRGGLRAARDVIARLRLALHAPSLGGVETLVCRPASTSHAALPAEVRARMGIDDALIRVSVGIEDTSDLLDDFARALE
ncbi:MAG: trans-sulfuration enzyme family protein [Planctomycetota bacterium]